MRDLPPPLSVQEALDATGINIEVPEGESLTVGPFEPRYYEAFRLARISEFQDLQALGLVPDEVEEQVARSALIADDRAYAEQTFPSLTSCAAPKDCSCTCDSSTRYSRRMVQTHLMDVLQPHSSVLLDAASPSVIHPYFHLTKWFTRPALYLIGINVLQDIVIGQRATLTMTAAVRGLYAHDITIGSFGTLRFTSGAVHVKCNTLNGPSPFTSSTTTLERIGKYITGLSRENEGGSQ